VELDLQALINQCYDDSWYEGDINYERDPEPPLTGDDAKWADQLLRERGLRTGRQKKTRRRRRGS
jgi:hypothetical protein